jgi:4-alpha-glucanotransferase
MKSTRSAGIILHPTSLPGPDGIGDLGPEAYQWVRFLKNSGCNLWQVLPLGPTGYGDSPYQAFSAFAGNPYLISPALLLDDELITGEDLADRPIFPAGNVDFGPVIQWKLTLLERAYTHLQHNAAPELQAAISEFQASQASWLNDYALFMAIKEAQGGVSWDSWPEALRNREPAALQDFVQKHPEATRRHIFRQFLFFKQWLQLKAFANENGVRIIGDIPIFVAYDSAEVWAKPELFYLDDKGKPTVVAGVPPDYFSPTGQLWGNPLYRWDVHAQTGYTWWIERVRAMLNLVDIIRVDHFRGFAGYWEVAAGLPTAEIGQWVNGPGAGLFYAIQNELGGLPIIAEDLGEITPDVVELRETLDLPGMKVLQFSFSGDPHEPFLPHNYPVNCVAYTGTHDNDTSLGWYETAPEKERDFARRYLARSGDEIPWDMIRAVWSSVAAVTLAPLQDFLCLPGSARMNMPGKASGNWSWRISADVLQDDTLVGRIREVNFLYGRVQASK